MSKDLLKSYYDQKYKHAAHGADISIPKGYPKNRYEAAVYWGKGSGKALEISAGAGQVTSFLSTDYNEYIATEFSLERKKYLEETFADKANIKIMQCDIEEKKLPFEEGYFDAIIMVSVIEHLIEPISAIKYCYWLLKPGGKILIHTPNIAKWTRRVKLLFGYFPSTGSLGEGFITYDKGQAKLHDDGHLHYFTFGSLRRLLKEKAGFREIKYCGYGSLLSKFLPTLFSECFLIGIK